MLTPDIFSLKGKVALVTGASGGLGRYFAMTLAKAGANVVVAARREEKIIQVATEIEEIGKRALAVKLDVTSRKNIKAAFDESERYFSTIDILVNNAGLSGREETLDISSEGWDEVMDTNLKGVWSVSQEAANRMIKTEVKGSIINISSILGLRVMSGILSYSVSKAGVAQMTRALALEWARYGIRVNAIAPGYFETDLNRDMLRSELGEKIRKRIPQRRTGEVEELRGLLLLLASSASSYMTGQVIAIDGGHLTSSL